MHSRIINLLKRKKIERLYYSAIAKANGNSLSRLASVLITEKIKKNFGCYLSVTAEVGPNLTLKHPVGIVIGDGVSLGENVVIYQNVTLGARRLGEGKKNLYPKVGNNVVIFAGAQVIGPVEIGDNAIIGANAVVLTDVPPGFIATGIPSINRPPKGKA